MAEVANPEAVTRRLKVMKIVGTRPEVIKLSRVIAELAVHTDHVLVHTGQNYDRRLNEIFFEELQIPAPDYHLEAVGRSTAETIGLVIAKVDEVLAKEQPDAVLFYGDTNSTLAAIAAKRRQIPIFHMEAGNRCFDERVPEEINRRILDHISDINLPLSEHARRYLLAEGLRPETVIKTGSTMPEVLAHYRDGYESSDVLERSGLTARGYFLVSIHREENVDDPAELTEILSTLGALAERYARPVIVSTHPRTRKRLEGQNQDVHELVSFVQPFGFFDYVKLQQNALCVLSDSGSLTEEAAILDLPAVALRKTHERPEGMDEGTVVMAGLRGERVLQAVDLVTRQRGRAAGRTTRPIADYGPDDVSLKVVRVILSYVDYVNRTVWSKHT